jgi:DNA-binding winged helix-turn-helix (wHTH) protein
LGVVPRICLLARSCAPNSVDAHIAILALSPGFAASVKDAFSADRHRCTVVVGWPEIVASLTTDRPDLIVVERQALGQVTVLDLAKVAANGPWPPLLITGTEITHIAQALASAGQLGLGEPQYYEVGNLRIDTRRKRATIGERWVALPPIQYRLLLTLARQANEVVTSQELLRIVWGYEASSIEARELVKAHIRQIRRRLGLDPEKHHYIRSVRGFGYLLTSPDEED